MQQIAVRRSVIRSIDTDPRRARRRGGECFADPLKPDCRVRAAARRPCAATPKAHAAASHLASGICCPPSHGVARCLALRVRHCIAPPLCGNACGSLAAQVRTRVALTSSHKPRSPGVTRPSGLTLSLQSQRFPRPIARVAEMDHVPRVASPRRRNTGTSGRRPYGSET